jgi:hypothetical protein
MTNSICVDNLDDYIIIDDNDDENIDIINILQMDGLSKNNKIKELDNKIKELDDKLNIYIKTMYDVIKYFNNIHDLLNNSDDLSLSLNNITNEIFFELFVEEFIKIYNKDRKFNNILIDIIKRFPDNKKIVKTIVSNSSGCTLQYASAELKNNIDIVKSAIYQNIFALKHASNELKQNAEIIKLANEINASRFSLETMNILLQIKNNNNYSF